MAIINTYTKLTKTQANAKVFVTYTEDVATKMVAEEVDRAGNPYGKMTETTFVTVTIVAHKTRKGAENTAAKTGATILGAMTLREVQQAVAIPDRNTNVNATYKGNLTALKLNRKAKA